MFQSSTFSGLMRLIGCRLSMGALLSIGACYGVESTEFPPGLEPINPDFQAPLIIPNGDDPFPEQIQIAHGEGVDADGIYEWIHARALVKHPLSQVRDAFYTPKVVADRRAVDICKSRDIMPPSADIYAREFVLEYEVHHIITVNFDVTWRLGLVRGETAEPEVIAARFQKTWGTTAIDLMAGSVVLTALEENITEIQLIEHLRAALSGSEELESYVRDLYSSVLAQVKGEALPTYD